MFCLHFTDHPYMAGRLDKYFSQNGTYDKTKLFLFITKEENCNQKSDSGKESKAKGVSHVEKVSYLF